MNRFPKVYRYVGLEEMQQVLDFCYDYTFVVFRKKEEDETFRAKAYIEDLKSNLKVSVKIGGHAATYVFKLDTGEIDQKVTGVEAYRIMCKYYKPPKVKKIDSIGSARPFMYINKRYNKTRCYAYGYDLNSAYSWAMLQDIPDTTKVTGVERDVKSDEIGFITTNVNVSPNEQIDVLKDELIMVEKGYADIIFKRMPSPFTKFVDTWYGKKNKASIMISKLKNQLASTEDSTKKKELLQRIEKQKQLKIKAKGVLNYSIGYLQNKNPYIRATILTRVNNRIAQLIDSDTLFCNTDSLVSRKRRIDIEQNVGLDVGMWKLEHEGYFAYVSHNYQWDDNVPSYKGVPKAWFKKGYDILTDPVPERKNKYYLDHNTLKIKKCIYKDCSNEK